MKKNKRIVCMLLAAVMLLGAVPANAAAPLSPLAALLAIPVSGQVMNALPVSDSIAKALAVEEIETAYSTETRSAPTSAPVEQTTFAAPTANRLPDGTTGATEGLVGKTVNGAGTGSNGVKINDTYASPDGNNVSIGGLKKTGYLDKYLTAYKNPGKVRVIINPKYWNTPSDLVGATIPAGLIVDVYQKDIDKPGSTFVCQYDTRDGSPLTITVAPGSAPKTVVTPARTSFNDVKPGDWYYEAVTALSEGGLIHTVFDTDANGNFNPDAPVTQSECDFISARMRGQDTEGFKTNPNANATPRYQALRNLVGRLQDDKSKTTLTADELALAKQTNATYGDNPGVMATAYYNVWKKAARPNAEYYYSGSQTADAKAIRQSVDAYVDKAVRNGFGVFANPAEYEEPMRLAYNLGLVRLEGSPEVIDLNAPITRAEYCVALYKTGYTSFGCAPVK